MATHSTLIYNPTSAAVTIGGNTVQPGQTGTFALNDATTDAYAWIDAFCLLTSSVTPAPVPCAVCGYKSVPGAVLQPDYQVPVDGY